MSDDRDYVFAETPEWIRCAHCDRQLFEEDAVHCDTCGERVGPDCTAGECAGAPQPNGDVHEEAP